MRTIENLPEGFVLPKMYSRIAPDSGWWSGIQTTSIKLTNYGFRVNRFSHYATIESIKCYMYPNGFIKGHSLYQRNYCPDERFTDYFNNLGETITRGEFQKMTKGLKPIQP